MAEKQWTREEIDDQFLGGYEEPSDEDIAAEECGRWRNGTLDAACVKAGSEECDLDCPYRNSLKF